MLRFLARILITAFGLWVADAILPGVRADDIISLWFAALLLGLINAFVRPVIVILTLPITFLTLGLFLFVVNGALLLLVARLVPTFHVSGLGTAILATVIVGATSWLASWLTGDGRGIKVEVRRR